MVKKGFTLAEALIVMTILSIFFAFAAKAVTTKPRQKRVTFNHGYYECYHDGSLKQRYVVNGIAEQETAVANCNFEVRPGTAMFWILAQVGEVNFYNLTEPNVNRNLEIQFNADNLMSINDTVIIPTENMTKENFRSNIAATNDDANIYNGGDTRNGVIISW